MSDEAIAVIIAAAITAVGTIIATKFDLILDLVLRSARPVAGTWEGVSYILSLGPVDDTLTEQKRAPDIQYMATLKQTGKRITGTFTMTKAVDDISLYVQKYKGYIKNDYFAYECFTTQPEKFRLSAGLLHIHTSGNIMKGYFVTNTARSQSRTIVGFTVMKKREG